MPLIPKRQRDTLATVEIALLVAPVATMRPEKPMSIVGESRALPRKTAKAKIAAFVETLSDREPQHQPRAKVQVRAMTESERTKSLAKYHARMAAMTPTEKEEFRRHKNEIRRRRNATKKGVHCKPPSDPGISKASP